MNAFSAKFGPIALIVAATTLHQPNASWAQDEPADSPAVAQAKAEQAEAEAKAAEAKAKLAKLTAGLEVQSAPKSGKLEGDATLYVPQILAYTALNPVVESIGEELESECRNKTVIFMSAEGRAASSITALEVNTMFDRFSQAIDNQKKLNSQLVVEFTRIRQDHKLLKDWFEAHYEKPVGEEDGRPLAEEAIDEDARIAGSGIAGVLAGVGLAADLAGMFKSEYKIATVDFTLEASALTSLLSGQLLDSGCAVMDPNNAHIVATSTVARYSDILAGQWEIGASNADLAVNARLYEALKSALAALLVKMDKALEAIAAEEGLARDTLADAIRTLKLLNADLQSLTDNTGFAITKSTVLNESISKFLTAMITTGDSKLSPLMYTALNELVEQADFVLDAATLGSGGEGYVEDSFWHATRASAIAGVFVHYRLIDKDGKVVKAGLESNSRVARYKLKEIEKITRKTITDLDQDWAPEPRTRNRRHKYW